MRRVPLIVAIVVVSLLAIGGTVSAMTLTHSGFIGNGYGYGMMGGRQGYQRMIGGPSGYQGMMGGLQNRGNMMRGYQQSPIQQGNPATGMTHLTIQNVAYQPATIQVRVGTTVTWTNQDNVPHSVTFQNGMKDSGLLAQGQSFSYTFNAPGTYQYYCTVHPYMVAIVTVIA